MSKGYSNNKPAYKAQSASVSATTRAVTDTSNNAPRAKNDAMQLDKDESDTPEAIPWNVEVSELSVVGETEEISDVEADGDGSTLPSSRFAEESKLLLIPSVDYRMMCWWTECNSISQLKSANYSEIPMIAFLLMQSQHRFMKQKGYTFAGEINFDDRGNPVPVGTHVWSVKGIEHVFTRTGYLFFEHKSGNRDKNVVMYNYSDFGRGIGGIVVYAKDADIAKKFLIELEEYAKTDNCLRSAKMRDINMMNASFVENKQDRVYSWDTFYYPKNVRDMFELEVFGFLQNAERYNACGIMKRGVMMYGPPGTGKTSIGHLICQQATKATVIWITPDLVYNNAQGRDSIKNLYKLADFVSPTVIILEDIDLFGEDRDSQVGNLGLGGLMNILDGVNSVKNAVTVAMTNRIELIEKALSNRPGRFDRICEIPVLNKKLRKTMFTDRLSDCDVDADESVIDYIVEHTEKWTGAEVQEFVNSLNMYFISKNCENNRTINKKVADHVLGTMSKYALRESNMNQEKRLGSVGFHAVSSRDD